MELRWNESCSAEGLFGTVGARARAMQGSNYTEEQQVRAIKRAIVRYLCDGLTWHGTGPLKPLLNQIEKPVLNLLVGVLFVPLFMNNLRKLAQLIDANAPSDAPPPPPKKRRTKSKDGNLEVKVQVPEDQITQPGDPPITKEGDPPSSIS